ncbi:MAG: hypothetical protein ABL934_19495, partial [Lysobacteraceae bacterium]
QGVPLNGWVRASNLTATKAKTTTELKTKIARPNNKPHQPKTKLKPQTINYHKTKLKLNPQNLKQPPNQKPTRTKQTPCDPTNKRLVAALFLASPNV